MRLADQRREHPLWLTAALGDYSRSLMRWVVISTTLERVPRRAQALCCGEFWVSPRDLLCGVSLPGGGTTGVGVDERVEGASSRLTWFVLFDVDQVEQAAPPVRPLIEPHGNVASFDDPDQSSYEVEAVRTVISGISLHPPPALVAFVFLALALLPPPPAKVGAGWPCPPSRLYSD